MRRLISLADELRAIRMNERPNHHNGSGGPAAPKETDRPWQADVDRLQQTMREVLRAIASLSGVDLPNIAPDPQNPDAPAPQLAITTLKDRIRNELEGFSVQTADEVAKRGEARAQSALEEIENRLSGRIDQITGEFREKLQTQVEPEHLAIDVSKQSKERVTELVQAQMDEFARWVWLMCKGTETPIPVQIQKLMEPYAEQAISGLEGSFRQKAQDLLAEQERLIQDRFAGTMNSLQNQINALEQTAVQTCEQKIESVEKAFADRLSAAGEDVAKVIENKINDEVENSLGRATSRIESALQNSLESYSQQLASLNAAGLEEQRKEMAANIGDIAGRLKRAGELLAGLDPETLRHLSAGVGCSS
jgi:hypothetical protein